MSYSIDELKLAFGYHIVRLILETDTVITMSETDYLERVFSRDQMSAAGFIGADGGFTEKHTEALREAVASLPERLTAKEKSTLLTRFFDATLSDGQFDTDEGSVLVQAAKMLGVQGEALDAFLESLDDVGSLDLPEPEAE